MKQSESKSTVLSDATAVLRETSNNPENPMPKLTIMIPYRPEMPGVTVNDPPQAAAEPPASIQLQNNEVRRLYDFLHEYFSES